MHRIIITHHVPGVVGLGQQAVELDGPGALVYAVQVAGQSGQHCRLAAVDLAVSILVLDKRS
jgi:hypothetical protein